MLIVFSWKIAVVKYLKTRTTVRMQLSIVSIGTIFIIFYMDPMAATITYGTLVVVELANKQSPQLRESIGTRVAMLPSFLFSLKP